MGLQTLQCISMLDLFESWLLSVSLFFFLESDHIPYILSQQNVLPCTPCTSISRKKNRTDGVNTLTCSYNNNNIRQHKTLDITLSSRQVFFNLIAETSVYHIIVVTMWACFIMWSWWPIAHLFLKLNLPTGTHRVRQIVLTNCVPGQVACKNLLSNRMTWLFHIMRAGAIEVNWAMTIKQEFP